MRDLIEIVRADLDSYAGYGKRRSFFNAYFLIPGFRVSFWYRLVRWLKSRRMLRFVAPLAMFMFMHYRHVSGVQLNVGAEIGPGLYIPHFGGIVVNPRARIGKNCYLSHNVLIGKVHAGPKKGVPRIGDNVFIGTGAALVGDIDIGDNAAIGINSVVTDDVPSGVFVAGAPAKVVANKTAGEILGVSKDLT